MNVREATNINVTNIRVGAGLPRTITDYWVPVPAPIISIVPEWSDYRVVRIHNEILVVDPETFEIVYVFDARLLQLLGEGLPFKVSLGKKDLG